MRLPILLFTLVFISFSCSTPKKISGGSNANDYTTGGKVWSSAFQQQAAEYKALCYQAFNIARLRLDEAIARNTTGRPLAIVTDIDETILDNSPYAVKQALLGNDFSQSTWEEWTSMGNADTMPGALAFLKYAASKNVTTFYITNRYDRESAGTLQNLKRFGFPFADDAHLLARTAGSGKEERRKKAAEAHEIVLLLGDNLSDFSSVFDKKPADERDAMVNANAGEFGNRFIILPNFNYGGWEEAMFEFRYNWNAAQKDSILRSKLKGY